MKTLLKSNNSRKLEVFAFQPRLSAFKGACICTNVSLTLQRIECPNTHSLLLRLCTCVSWTEALCVPDIVCYSLCYPYSIYHIRRNTRLLFGYCRYGSGKHRYRDMPIFGYHCKRYSTTRKGQDRRRESSHQD